MVDGLWLADGLFTEAEKILKAEYGESYTQENRDKMLEMLITHGHEDHAGKGMEEFLNAGCNVYVPEKDWPLLAEKYEEKKSQIIFLTEEMCRQVVVFRSGCCRKSALQRMPWQHHCTDHKDAGTYVGFTSGLGIGVEHSAYFGCHWCGSPVDAASGMQFPDRV